MGTNSSFRFICTTLCLFLAGSAFAQPNTKSTFSDSVLEQLIGTYMVSGPNGPEIVASISANGHKLVMREANGTKLKTLFESSFNPEENKITPLPADGLGLIYTHDDPNATRETTLVDNQIRVRDITIIKSERTVEERHLTFTPDGIQMEIFRSKDRKRFYLAGDWVPKESSAEKLFYQKMRKQPLSGSALLHIAVTKIIDSYSPPVAQSTSAEVIQLNAQQTPRTDNSSEVDANQESADIVSFVQYRKNRLSCERKLRGE